MQDFYHFFLEEISFIKAFYSIFFAFLAFFLIKKFFYKINFVDKPNKRSNHKEPVALGGGVILIPLIILISVQFGYDWKKDIMLSIFILFFISFLDDIKNINSLIRLFFHISAISIFVAVNLSEEILKLAKNYKYIYLLILITVTIFLAWFLNAFNFMDGINGITSIQVLSISISLIFFNYFIAKELNILAVSILLPMVIFCFHNWNPASIFLGDAGSIPLGFLMIILLSDLALKGYWVSALTLPMYYILDTSITLTKRIFNGKKFWQAHNQHYYQQALKNGLSHTRVSYFILLINIGLFFLSFSALIYKNNIYFLFIGLFWCLIFLKLFSEKNKSI